MIVSVSRRTDIPAFYADWFRQRLQAGFVTAVNPYRPSQSRRVELTREAVTAFVFWTKNPRPFLETLNFTADRGYPFILQISLTPYGSDLEPGIDRKNEMTGLIRQLADWYGPERLIWRYDPIILNQKYNLAFHRQAFQRLAETLAGAVSQCTISFFDAYRHLQPQMNRHQIYPAADQTRIEAASALLELAQSAGMVLKACCESNNLQTLGIQPASCIDRNLIEKLSGIGLPAGVDRNQRPGCNCCPSVDLGAYQTCLHGCRYCYATRNSKKAQLFHQQFDARSESLSLNQRKQEY